MNNKNIDLNNKLLKELKNKYINLDNVGCLLKLGANPLGPYEQNDDETVVEEVLSYYAFEKAGGNDAHLNFSPKLFEFLIKNGMNVSDISAMEKDKNLFMWEFAFYCSKPALWFEKRNSKSKRK